MSAEPPKFKMPKDLDLEEQLAFCIGNLVASWANCESMFWGMLNCIVGKPDTTISQIIWLSMKSTKARVDLTIQLLNAINVHEKLKMDIADCASKFDGITRTRNFYCHSFYSVDPASLSLKEIVSHSFNPKTKTYFSDVKKMSKATVNELVDANQRALDLNSAMWIPFLELRETLKALHVTLPEPFPEFLHPK